MSRETAGPASAPLARQAAASCPDCGASLAILRIITGRAGAEYWTMRCTACGGIHLEIVNPSPSPAPLTA